MLYVAVCVAGFKGSSSVARALVPCIDLATTGCLPIDLFPLCGRKNGFQKPHVHIFFLVETTAERTFPQHQHLIPGETLIGSILVTRHPIVLLQTLH